MLLSRSLLSSAVALLSSTSLFHHVSAQVTTDCQPLNRTDCPPDPAFAMDFNFNFNSTPSSSTWQTTVGPVTYDKNNGATFTINKQGDSPTIRSKFYIFFGRVEIWMKAAAGTGIISSVMFLSDTLDEIDWEFMGGNTTHVETNYFGKGVPDFHNAIYYPVNGGILNDYHNYTTLWTNTSLQYFVDGQLVRTLLPKDANNTLYYPQTPMKISLGIWAGGDPTLPQGTREWAGGDTDYSKGPFTMFVKSAHVSDFSSGKEYTYGDKSGSWESIRIVSGNSTVHDDLTAPPAESIGDKWNHLSSTAKIAIYASGAGVGTALLAFAAFYCIRQRRRGAREARIAEAKAEEERRELAAFKAAGVDPDSLAVTGSEYNPKEMRREGMTANNAYSVPASPVSPDHPNEKWQNAATVSAGAGAGGLAAAAAGARSPMPLLHEGAQSPRVGSPGPQNYPYNRAMYNASPGNASGLYPDTRSPAPLISPMRSPSPGMQGMQVQQHQQQFSPQPNRSFSTPIVQMRGGSQGPQQGGMGYGMPAPQNPNPMMAPHPQRSFTTTGYPPQTGNSYGGDGYGHPGSDQYWGNNNHR